MGDEDYEGIGEQHRCGTYTYLEGVLRDSDGDRIPTRNIKEGPLPSKDFAPDLENESSEENEEDECVCDHCDFVLETTASCVIVLGTHDYCGLVLGANACSVLVTGVRACSVLMTGAHARCVLVSGAHDC